MRLWSISALSLLVTGACVVILMAMPGLRYATMIAAGLEGRPLDCGQYAKSHPRDYKAWLAALATGQQPDEEEYNRAATLAARDPAPHVIFALKSLPKIPLQRNELKVEWPDLPVNDRPLTADEQAVWERAWKALDRAGRLDPENAAVDFARAYLALAVHQDQTATQVLRSALRKQHFRLYIQAAEIALYETVRTRVPAYSASQIAMGEVTMLGPFAQFRQMARVMKAFWTIADQKGDHARAIFLRESLLHTAELMWRDGDTLIEALVAMAIWDIASGERLTAAEEAAATRGTRRPTNTESENWLPYWNTVRSAEEAKFARYLCAHGRDDLAARVTALSKVRDEWLAASRSLAGEGLAEWDVSKTRAEALRVAVWAAEPALGLACLCGLIALATGLARRPVRPIQWPRWGWLTLVVACSVCAFVLWSMVLDALRERRTYPEFVDTAAFSMQLLVAGLCAIVAMVVFVHRRCHREVREVGFPRHYLGTLLALVLPVTALVCPLVVGTAWAAAGYQATLTRQWVGEIYQDELRYHHLTLAEWEHKRQ